MTTSTGNLAKLTITLLEPQPGGKAGSRIDEIKLSFNPKEVTLSRSINIEAKQAKKPQPPEFKGAAPGQLSLEAFLDAELCEDAGTTVAASVEKLMTTLRPTAKTRNSKPFPPLLHVTWGSTEFLTGVMKQVQVKYTLFSSEGEPMRAACTLTIQEMPQDPAKQNPTSGALDVRTTRVLTGSDTLASVAFAEYGDPSMWRAIADANGIDDPQRVPRGTRLLLPPPEEAAAHR